MKVQRLESDRPDARLYEVSGEYRWWTVCIDSGGASIFNSQLRELDPAKPTGKLLLAAISESGL